LAFGHREEMSMPSDHHLTGKQALVAFTVGGGILAAVLGPSACREMFLPEPPLWRVFLIVCILLGAIIGFVVFRIATEFIAATFLWLFLAALSRIVPKPILARAAERRLHPAVVGLMFAILLLLFRDLVGVLTGLFVVAALLGIPVLLHKVEQWVWRVILRRRADR
jgi:MFS family permease